MHYLLFHALDHFAIAAPDRTAFRCGDASLSYAAAAARSNQLARLLISQNVERSDRVGIYLGRSLEAAVAVYGVLKAGAAYVPLDPAAPPERTRRLIRDCGIRVLITAPALRRKIPALLEGDSPLQFLLGHAPGGIAAAEWMDLHDYPPTPPQVRLLDNDLAYVMYTSGSTGEPKGIMHTHRSGMAYARLSAECYGVRPDDIIGNHCALHYDISTFGYFTAPYAGATTVIVSDAHTKFPTSLLQLIARERITIWYSVPLALLQLLRAPTLATTDLSALRWILFGGEVFAPRHLRALLLAAPNARASNVYGPAEVNQCTYHHLDTPTEGDAPLPLGVMWDNTEGLVVDENDAPVPRGQVGELLVRSATLMKGYWRQPELTARSLYHRERAPGLWETFYRTGDQVYTGTDGLLYFVGRKDRQVKVRGHRVELEEVEAALCALPGVSEAAVFTRNSDDHEKIIQALVVAANPTGGTPRKWIEALARVLPPHAVPAGIELVDIMPRTDAGKIDRLAIMAAKTHNTV